MLLSQVALSCGVPKELRVRIGIGIPIGMVVVLTRSCDMPCC